MISKNKGIGLMFKIILQGAAVALGVSVLAACAPVQQGDGHDATVDATQCRIEDWQSWVGKPRSELPAAAPNLVFRVLCEECMATMDYRSDRVTFTYDDKGIISRVSCG